MSHHYGKRRSPRLPVRVLYQEYLCSQTIRITSSGAQNLELIQVGVILVDVAADIILWRSSKLFKCAVQSRRRNPLESAFHSSVTYPFTTKKPWHAFLDELCKKAHWFPNKIGSSSCHLSVLVYLIRSFYFFLPMCPLWTDNTRGFVTDHIVASGSSLNSAKLLCLEDSG